MACNEMFGNFVTGFNSHVDMHKDQNNNLTHAEGTTMIAGIGERTTNVDLQGLGKEASGIQDTIFLIHHELRCGRPRGP